MITVEDLTKIYDEGGQEIVAVNELNVSIADGEFLTLVGPSGCGKSTTLRCLAGLESVTSGRIYLNDEDITNRKPVDRNMAMVFQSYALYPHMTARQNMSFGLKMTTDLSKAEIQERVEDAAAMMGIDELLEKKPSELSGGQQQRVALGRAIVRDPEVFLLDEPLSNLDAKLRTQMRTELQNLQQRLGVTTVYVTHDQVEAMTMSDRIIIMNDGELQQVGTPLECYYKPTNKFVAGFLGSPSMNFFEVHRSDDVLTHPSFKYRLSDRTTSTITAYDDLTLGVRPEDIQLTDEKTSNAIRATVNVVEPMGDTAYVTLELESTTCTASITDGPLPTSDEEVFLTFQEQDVHLFESESGHIVKQRETTDDQMALNV